MNSRAKVDVFAYRDYRAFLRAYSQRHAAEKDGFSASAFVKSVGLRSPNYLKLVIEGERNLGADLAQRFAVACGLRDDAVSYFCALVAFNQSKTTRERALHYETLQGFRRFRAAHRLDAAQSAYHAEWYIPAVFELTSFADFDEDPHWIARTLQPAISPKQAKEALSVLEELGLVVRNEDSKVVQAQSVVETPEGPLGHHIVQYHRAMMERAAEAIDIVPRAEREIASLTLALSEESMAALKAELSEFRNRLAERYQADACPERVVQVNFQMFPLSKKKG